jgi:LCP family protein required for cell wall assembly
MRQRQRNRTPDSFTISQTYPQQAGTSRAPESIEKPRRHFSIWKLIKRIFVLIIILVIATGGYVGYKFYQNAAKVTGDSSPLQLLSLLHNVPLRESDGRVNILLAGNSVDDPDHQGAELTDSIMIVSYDPATKHTVLISIPRDMWVEIPGYGHEKINAAYEDGQQGKFSQSGYDSGGMGQLEEVVQQDFGISTDYYALIDYTAFRDAVNAVGGVTVTINSTDPNGLYDPNTNLKLPNGPVTLDGQEALNLARARGDGVGSYGFPDGDFNRTQHQQQLLVALEQKATSAGVLSNPLKIVQLSNSIGNNIKTDMNLGQILTFYRGTKTGGASSTKSYTLNNINGKDLLTSYVSDGGEDALIPAAGYDDYTQIQNTVANIINAN